MATQTEYALMSANVYGNYPDTNGTNPVRSSNNNLPIPAGWTQISSVDYKQNTPNTGFTFGARFLPPPSPQAIALDCA